MLGWNYAKYTPQMKMFSPITEDEGCSSGMILKFYYDQKSSIWESIQTCWKHQGCCNMTCSIFMTCLGELKLITETVISWIFYANIRHTRCGAERRQTARADVRR